MKQNNILQLIQNAEVEWKTLGEVAEIIRGVTYNKTLEVTENGYKILRANNITVEFSTLNFDDVKQISKDAKVKDTQKLSKNDILISVASGSREHVGKVAFIDENMDYYFGGFMAVIRSNEWVNPKYLFHILKSHYFSQFVETTFASATINNLSNSVLKGFEIPIPPLSIQQEIVKILDKLTELEATLEATLEAELSLREKQYNYYRDQLLTFGDEVEWKTLGEVAKIKNGKDWKHLNVGNIPVYGSGGIMAYVDKYTYDKTTVLIPRKGSITNIFYVTEPFWNVDTIYYTEINELYLLPKFFYYFMKTIDLMTLDTGSGRPSLTQAILNEIKIPIPPLSTQEKIVDILDKFDTLTTSITEGLPKEIELRRKQYEYYRELLLSFPKP